MNWILGGFKMDFRKFFGLDKNKNDILEYMEKKPDNWDLIKKDK